MADNSPIDIDIIETEHELIEDAFEDLLIFPNKSTLQRCIQLIESHFNHEQTFLQQCASKESQVEHQQQILDAMRGEMDGRAVQSRDCSSWIQPPQAIKKGVHKNAASRFAAMFMEHVEKFHKIHAQMGS